jgi:uncharacterized membrane protein YqgA involved in biofilm formation
MFGTLINAAAVLVGSTFGLLIKRGLSKHLEETALGLVGLGVFIIGINGIVTSMLTADLLTGSFPYGRHRFGFQPGNSADCWVNG